ncbi:MAG: NlpC/P60 family protein [Ginsengibacter sp.]
MKYFIRVTVIISLLFVLQACGASRKSILSDKVVTTETNVATKKMPTAGKSIPSRVIYTKNADPGSLVDFAETLIGTRYKYGSVVKEQGFDCSGFITYVFNHFNIQVPRISKDFTNAGISVPFEKSKPGDLILFTGTDTTGWVVGHMGIITQNEDGKIKFIHSSSGKSVGVVISGMSKYYETRFVKVIRVFQP